MKVKAPIVTLLAGLVIAGALFVLNVDLTNDVARNRAAADRTPPAATGAPPPSEAAPSPKPSLAAQGGTVTYAGRVQGGQAALAVVVNNGKAIAYVCDGKSVEAWLQGTAADGRIELTGAQGSLSGTYDTAGLTGTVTAGKKRWDYQITTAAPPSGAYRTTAAVRDRMDASWVRLPDGFQIGVQRRPDGTYSAAPNFDTTTNSVTVDGTRVTVEPGVPSNSGS